MDNNADKIIFTKKKMLPFGIIIFFIICIVLVFPIVKFNYHGRSIIVFAPERLLTIVGIRVYDFDGIVLGNHVFDTNLGEIVLHRSAKVYAGRLFTDSPDLGIRGIPSETFSSEFASHNLEFAGNALPQNISVSLHWGMIERIGGIDSEMILSGIPLFIEDIELRMPGNRIIHRRARRSDMYIPLRQPPEFIVLADSTIIQTNNRTLFLYKNDERWLLTDSSVGTIDITFPNEYQPVRYAFIEFGRDWGGFIDGETREVVEARREEERIRSDEARRNLELFRRMTGQ